MSIVTVVRDGEGAIEQAIASVLGQTYKNIEYAVIDGGSKDKTASIIKRYEKRLAFWVSEPDKGISDAFNKGIKNTTGEIIGLLNADDWYEPDAVEEVVKSYLQEEAAGVIHGNQKMWRDNKPLFTLFPDPRPEKIRFAMIYNHSACFVRRKCYETHGLFRGDLHTAMDYELLLRFHLKGVKFRHIDKTLANMRFGGMSYKKAYLTYWETFKVSTHYGGSLLKSAYQLIRLSLKFFLKGLLGGDEAYLVQRYRQFSPRKRVINNLSNDW